MIQLITAILAFYMLFESIDPLAKMRGGLCHFIHKIKYIASASLGVWSLYSIYIGAHIDIKDVGALMAVACFILPRTKYRIIHAWNAS